MLKVNAVFETEGNGIVGTTSAKVKRIEHQDDGSLTVVIDYWPQPAEPVKVPSDDLAHEIWAAAQTTPGEGIEDAVERITDLLARRKQGGDTEKVPSFVELKKLAIEYGIMAGPVLQGSRYAYFNEGERFNAFIRTILTRYGNCDSQPTEPMKVPEGYVLIAEKYLEEMIGSEQMDQLRQSCRFPVSKHKPSTQSLTDEYKAILKECRDKAMDWTVCGRIPECGMFGQIAQDLDYLCEQLGIDND